MSDKHLAYSTVFVVREFERHEAIIRKGVPRRSDLDSGLGRLSEPAIRKTQISPIYEDKYPI